MMALEDLAAHSSRKRPRDEGALRRPTRGQLLSALCHRPEQKQGVAEEAPVEEVADEVASEVAAVDGAGQDAEPAGSAFEEESKRHLILLGSYAPSADDPNAMEHGTWNMFADGPNAMFPWSPAGCNMFGPNAMFPVEPAGLAANAQDLQRALLPRLELDPVHSLSQMGTRPIDREIARLQRLVKVRTQKIADYKPAQTALGLERVRGKARSLAGSRGRVEFEACKTTADFTQLIMKYSAVIPGHEKEITELKIQIEQHRAKLRKAQELRSVVTERERLQKIGQKIAQDAERVAAFATTLSTMPLYTKNDRESDSDFEYESPSDLENGTDDEGVDESNVMRYCPGLPSNRPELRNDMGQISFAAHAITKARQNMLAGKKEAWWMESDTVWFAETDRVTIPFKSLSVSKLKRKAVTQKVGATANDIEAIENDSQRLSCKCRQDCWLKSQLIALIKAKWQETCESQGMPLYQCVRHTHRTQK